MEKYNKLKSTDFNLIIKGILKELVHKKIWSIITIDNTELMIKKEELLLKNLKIGTEYKLQMYQTDNTGLILHRIVKIK